MSTKTEWELTAAAQQALLLPDAARLEYLRSDRWAGYPAATKIIKQLDELVSYPKSTRMPSLAIAGRPNNGKSKLIQRFVERHPAKDLPDGLRIPVVPILMPSAPDEGSLYLSILSRLQVSHRPAATVKVLKSQIYSVLAGMYAQVLVVDEFHHLNASSVKNQEATLAALKNLSSALKLCLVIVGTRDLFGALRADPQLATRFKTEGLPHWRDNDTTRRVLVTFETQLPLKERSFLGGHQLARDIVERGEGTIGGMKTVVIECAKVAINTGEERITRDIVRDVDVTTASDFERLARMI